MVDLPDKPELLSVCSYEVVIRHIQKILKVFCNFVLYIV